MISQKKCWRNNNTSSGEGSKLVNLFFLPNESDNMRTLNYLRGCVPTALLLQSMHMSSPSSPRFQIPHQPTHQLLLPLALNWDVSFWEEALCDSHITNALFHLSISITPICLIRLTHAHYVPGHVLYTLHILTHSSSPPAYMILLLYSLCRWGNRDPQRLINSPYLRCNRARMKTPEYSFSVHFLIIHAISPLKVSKFPYTILFCLPPASDWELLKVETMS